MSSPISRRTIYLMLIENTYLVVAVAVLLAGLWLFDRYGTWYSLRDGEDSRQLQETRIVFDPITGLYTLSEPDRD